MNSYDRFCDLLDKSDVGRALAQQAREALRRSAVVYPRSAMEPEVAVLLDWLDEQGLEGLPPGEIATLIYRWHQRYVIGFDPARPGGDESVASVWGTDEHSGVTRLVGDYRQQVQHVPAPAEVWGWWPEHIPLGDRIGHAVLEANPADLYVAPAPSMVTSRPRVCRHERTNYSWLGNRLDFSVYRAPGCRFVYVVLHHGSVTLDEAARLVEMEEADRARTRSRASFTRDVMS